MAAAPHRGSMVVARHSTTSSGASPSAEDVEHEVGDVGVDLARDLDHSACRAPADDDVADAGEAGQLGADDLGVLLRGISAEEQHGCVSRRCRRRRVRW